MLSFANLQHIIQAVWTALGQSNGKDKGFHGYHDEYPEWHKPSAGSNIADSKKQFL